MKKKIQANATGVCVFAVGFITVFTVFVCCLFGINYQSSVCYGTECCKICTYVYLHNMGLIFFYLDIFWSAGRGRHHDQHVVERLKLGVPA